MITDYLNENTISLHEVAKDKYEAIEIAGNLLVKAGKITPGYVEDMKESLDSLGPYIVITKGIAFAHARPSEKVLSDSTSMITLDTPVMFGNEKNDPVEILFVIAATQNKAHLSVMKEISRLISRKDFLMTMQSEENVKSALAYMTLQE